MDVITKALQTKKLDVYDAFDRYKEILDGVEVGHEVVASFDEFGINVDPNNYPIMAGAKYLAIEAGLVTEKWVANGYGGYDCSLIKA